MTTNTATRDPFIIPHHKKAEFNRLLSTPTIAVPTLMLLLWIVLGVSATYYLALTGTIELWQGMLLNIVFSYPVFHVAHDSLHRASAANLWLNDMIGRVSLVFATGIVSFSLFRYVHMFHHMHTNDVKDPDHYCFGKSPLDTFLRLASYDFYYIIYTIKLNNPKADRTLFMAVPQLSLICTLFIMSCYYGYWIEAVMLWLIPFRVTMFLIGFCFFWLPHLDSQTHSQTGRGKKAVASKQALTLATTMRLGLEPIMNVLLQWHNYHLLHHMWPTLPSYRLPDTWGLFHKELQASHDLHIQHNLDVLPNLQKASKQNVEEIEVEQSIQLQRYKCAFCSHVYDETKGDPKRGIAPGTLWQDVPQSWLCPDCGVSKSDYFVLD